MDYCHFPPSNSELPNKVINRDLKPALYMAPELLLHSNVSYDEKVDIWSLGAILYNMAAL